MRRRGRRSRRPRQTHERAGASDWDRPRPASTRERLSTHARESPSTRTRKIHFLLLSSTFFRFCQILYHRTKKYISHICQVLFSDSFRPPPLTNNTISLKCQELFSTFFQGVVSTKELHFPYLSSTIFENL